MFKLLLTIASGILGIWVASQFVPGVDFTGNWQTLLMVGIILGLINFYIKPVLKLISLPLRFLTLGLAGILINVGIIWAIDIIFAELVIEGAVPLLWTTLIIWGAGVMLQLK